MTTRYVDFLSGSDANDGLTKSTPWKRCKGMAGVTGAAAAATLAPGDTVIFKGNTTWTACFPWNLVGPASSTITYTTDPTWFPGAFTDYAQPVFDREGAGTTGAGNGILNGASRTTLNDLNFVNASNPGSTVSLNSVQALYYANCFNVTITNCVFNTESWIAIYFYFSSGSFSNFTWTGNDFSHCGSAIWFATDGNATMHTITYTDCTIHDFSSQIGNNGLTGPENDGTHGDGFFHYYSIPSSNANAYLDGMTFANNRAYGDFRRGFGVQGGMTAFFFAEGSCSVEFFNNDFSYEPAAASIFAAMIYLNGYDNTHPSVVNIRNNSFACIGVNAMSAVLYFMRRSATCAITFKNNIISTPQYGIYAEDASAVAALDSDRNLILSTGGMAGPSGVLSVANWKLLKAGLDANSVFAGTPDWADAPGDESIGAASSARGIGENFTSLGISLLNSDFDGVARPGSAAWDVGAYQYAAAAAGTPSGHAGRGMAFFT